MTHLIKLAAAGFALAAASTTASAQIVSNADCEYEGGEVFNVAEGTVCVVPVRAAEFSGEAYDGQQLGITECDGMELNDGAFCKIVLVPAPAKPDAEMPAETSMEMNDN